MNNQQQCTSHINDIWENLLKSEASKKFLDEQVEKAEELLLTERAVNSPPNLDS